MNKPASMSKRNSVTAFKRPERILPTTTPMPEGPEVPSDVQPSQSRGPKPKPKSQKRSHRVLLSLTVEEGMISKKKAGLAGEATAIYAFLHENGYFK